MSTVTSRREQIATDLRAAILDGRYGPGDALPSASELCAMYDASRVTVRRALELLHANGQGTVLRMVRMWADDIPVRLARMWFPTEWAAGTALAQPQRIRGGVAAMVESLRGRLAFSDVDLEGRNATDDEQDLLSLARGVTVVHTTTTFRDEEDAPVQEARRTGRRVETFDVDSPPTGTWHLLSAGVYEDDVATVRGARSLANRPRYICSVAAGVAQFADDVDDPQGILGIGQWTPGAEFVGSAGMDETDFLESWQRRFGGVPDYPGVQAYAAGVVAAAAVQSAGTAESGALWQEVIGMDMQTVFGRFRLDAENGEQIGHEAVLTQWRAGKICPLLQRGA
jgi:hypothetical protein